MKRTLAATIVPGSGVHNAKTAIATIFFGVALLLSGAKPSSAAPLPDCKVDFSDRTALLNLYEQAAGIFVWPSTMVNGKITNWQVPETGPTSAQTNMNRWQYRQTCASSRLSVWDQYSAMMLPPRYPWCLASRGFGRLVSIPFSGNLCLPIFDYAAEPRVAEAHYGSTWWEIELLDYVGGPTATVMPGKLRAFDLKKVEVGGTTPIQIWFRKTDGSVWGFNSLAAGATHDVSGSAKNIVAVWISAADSNAATFSLKSFTITPH